MANSTSKPRRTRPGSTPLSREQQLVALANDNAEQQMLNGTASSQIINHYLKQGSPKEALERQLLEKQIELMNAKIDAYKSAKEAQVIYDEVLDALRTYKGESIKEE